MTNEGLTVSRLSVYFPTPGGVARAVDGVSLAVAPGAALGLVGESGCGKSTLASALLRLLPSSARVGGVVHFGRVSLLDLPEKRLRAVRGRGMALVAQDPGAGFNPIYRLGSQLAEAVRVHQGLGRRAARDAGLDLLRAVQLDDPERVARQYAHEVSGGMLQRVAIALALAGRPRLLLADEPTSALDVTVQAGILALLRQLRDRLGMALLLIAHDLEVVARMTETVAVMYAGQVVETGPTARVLRRPLHPYTAALLACRPHLGQSGRLKTIEGTVPPATHFPTGCRFRDRCGFASDQCRQTPQLEEQEPGHWVACWHPGAEALVGKPGTAMPAFEVDSPADQ